MKLSKIVILAHQKWKLPIKMMGMTGLHQAKRKHLTLQIPCVSNILRYFHNLWFPMVPEMKVHLWCDQALKSKVWSRKKCFVVFDIFYKGTVWALIWWRPHGDWEIGSNDTNIWRILQTIGNKRNYQLWLAVS